MAYNVISCQKVAENTQSLNSLCKSGSRPQKSPKKAQKTDHSIAIYSNFWIGMVYFGYHLVKAHVQTVQNMYGKGGRESARPSYGRPKLTLILHGREWMNILSQSSSEEIWKECDFFLFRSRAADFRHLDPLLRDLGAFWLFACRSCDLRIVNFFNFELIFHF